MRVWPRVYEEKKVRNVILFIVMFAFITARLCTCKKACVIRLTVDLFRIRSFTPNKILTRRFKAGRKWRHSRSFNRGINIIEVMRVLNVSSYAWETIEAYYILEGVVEAIVLCFRKLLMHGCFYRRKQSITHVLSLLNTKKITNRCAACKFECIYNRISSPNTSAHHHPHNWNNTCGR